MNQTKTTKNQVSHVTNEQITRELIARIEKVNAELNAIKLATERFQTSIDQRDPSYVTDLLEASADYLSSARLEGVKALSNLRDFAENEHDLEFNPEFQASKYFK